MINKNAFIKPLLWIPERPKDLDASSLKDKWLIVVPDEGEILSAQSIFSRICERLGMNAEDTLSWLVVRHSVSLAQSLTTGSIPAGIVLCGIEAGQIGFQSLLTRHQGVRWKGTFLLRTEKPSVLAGASPEVKTGFWNAMKACLEETRRS